MEEKEIKLYDLLLGCEMYPGTKQEKEIILGFISNMTGISVSDLILRIKKPKAVAYMGHHFVPIRSFMSSDGDFNQIAMRLRFDPDFVTGYNHDEFYRLLPQSQKHYDIFKCEENGVLYVPCNYSFQQYVERNEING